MDDENINVKEAKKSLKTHIKFFEAMLQHIKGTDQTFKARAMWATWCLHQYINNQLMTDIEKAMKELGTKDEKE